MKTTLLILFSTCFGLLAQTPATTDDGSDPALRDAILRRVVRGEPATPPANGGAVPAAVAPAPIPAPTPTAIVPTPVVPVTPAQIVPVTPAPTIPAPTVPPFAQTAAAAPPVIPAATPATIAAAPAQPAPPPEEASKVANFPAIDLNTFLDVYGDLVDRTILRAATLQAPPITLVTQKPLTKTAMIEAMNTVLSMNGIVLINQGSNFVKAVPAATAQQEAQTFQTTNPNDLPEADEYISEIVQLKNVLPSIIQPYLQPFSKTGNLIALDSSSVLVIRDFASNVKRMLELTAQLDVVATNEYDSEIIPIKYAKAEDIAAALSSLGGTTATGIPGGRAGAPARPGGTLGSPGGGYPGGAGGAPGGINPINANPAGAQPAGGNTFQQRLRAVVGASAGTSDIKIFTGITKILPDSRANALLVFANKADMAMIKTIVNQIDVVLPQVLVEAIIMEVNLDDELNLGVSYVQNNPTTSKNGYYSGLAGLNNGTFLNGSSFGNSGTNLNIPGGLSYWANFGGDLQATATAIASGSKINVLSRPRIQTSHGVQASLKVGDTIPYISGTYFGGLNGQASSQYQQTFVGIDLEVTPLINSEGLVVMDTTLDIQQLGPSTTIDGNSVPSTTQRAAASTVSVKDRDTIILGGFISTTKSKSNSGVPVLKDIPVVGALFRSSGDSNKRVELIVLIRPTVLPTPASAAVAATQERDRMPGVKAAERQNRLDENRLLKKADKIVVPNERE